MLTDEVEFYRDKRGKYRWRKRAENGKIVSSSSQGYESDEDCRANFQREIIKAWTVKDG